MKVRTWVWIVVGVVGVGILCLIALGAAGFWFVRTHIEVQRTTPETISREFADVRAQFGSQKPLIELDDHGHVIGANTDRPAGSPRPDAVHILAFSAKDNKVVRMSIPFWLLRLKGPGSRLALHGQVDLGSGDFDLQRLNLTVEDLERYGPTLIVDHTAPDGARVLVWSR